MAVRAISCVAAACQHSYNTASCNDGLACTSNDADNLALCYYARTRFGVPRTISG